MTTLTRRNASARLAAGLDVGTSAVRLALVESDDEVRRVRAMERQPLSAGAVERGVVRDPPAVEAAVREAFARAEGAGRRVQTLVVATAADDLRSHRHVARVARSGAVPVSDAELRRVGGRARREAARAAVLAVGDEPGLRRIGLVALQATAAGVTLDGRPLVAVGKQRGELLEIELVVPVLPLSESSGLEAAVAPLRRDARYVAAPLALAALVAENGIEEAILVDIGASLTGVSVLREGAPLGARAFSLGAAELTGARDEGVATWARCALLAASDIAGAASLPMRVLVAGGGATRAELPTALGEAVARLQPTLGGHAEMLTPQLLRGVEAPFELESGDYVAVAAGCA